MTDTTCAAEAAVHRAAALAGQWLQAAGRTQDRATAERLRAYGTALRDALLGHPAEAPDCACRDARVGADTAALVYAHRTRTRDARRLAR